MSAGFTPGPWEAEHGSDEYFFVVSEGGMEFPFEQRDANARLIAAAPELYAASAEALAVLTADTIGTTRMDDPDWYCSVDSAVVRLRAALAKATNA